MHNTIDHSLWKINIKRRDLVWILIFILILIYFLLAVFGMLGTLMLSIVLSWLIASTLRNLQFNADAVFLFLIFMSNREKISTYFFLFTFIILNELIKITDYAYFFTNNEFLFRGDFLNIISIIKIIKVIVTS